MKIQPFALVSLLLVTSPSAADYFYDGNYLATLATEYNKAMKEEKDTKYTDAWAFRAFAIGVHDAMRNSGKWCSPSNIKERQVSSIAAKYIDDNPALWSESGADLVVNALQEAFPCSR